MDKFIVEVYTGEPRTIRDFHVKKNHMIIKTGKKGSYHYSFVTSLSPDGYTIWYRNNKNEEWSSSFLDDEETTNLFLQVRDSHELECAVKELHNVMQNEICIICDFRIEITTIVPGEKHRDGGEYGECILYTPVPGYPGIFTQIIRSTCDMLDDEVVSSYTHLTLNEYMILRETEADVLEKGSLY